MGYYPPRDNPDLVALPIFGDWETICDASEVIDASSRLGRHQDACNCDKGELCSSWYHTIASSEETLAWLVAQGFVGMSTIRKILEKERD